MVSTTRLMKVRIVAAAIRCIIPVGPVPRAPGAAGATLGCRELDRDVEDAGGFRMR